MGKAFIRCVANSCRKFFCRDLGSHTLLRQRSMACVVPEGPSRSGGVVGKVPQIKYLRFKPDQLEVH
jgi:hypothetical protein